ncbi:MAG: LysM peptidoglycan-binding domain-containing protein [Gaiellaceae bacterium]
MSVARTAAPVALLAAVTAAVVLLHQHAHPHARPHVVTAAVVHIRRHRAVRHTYRVAGGDTLGGIAGRLHTTVATLEALNPGLDPTALRVGQILRVK